MKIYAHYKDFPMSEWRWPDFKPYELRSKSDNNLAVDPDSMDKLQALRALLGRPLYLTSAYRSPAHNRKVGGAKNSQHMLAKAFDVQMRNHDPAKFEAAARQVGFTGFGFYEKSGFIHVDTGPAREWGDRWFPKPSVEPRAMPKRQPSPKPAKPRQGPLSGLLAWFRR